MKKKDETRFSLLFDNEKVMSNDELNSTKGGAICGNVPIVAGTAILGWVYVGVGAMQR